MSCYGELRPRALLACRQTPTQGSGYVSKAGRGKWTVFWEKNGKGNTLVHSEASQRLCWLLRVHELGLLVHVLTTPCSWVFFFFTSPLLFSVTRVSRITHVFVYFSLKSNFRCWDAQSAQGADLFNSREHDTGGVQQNYKKFLVQHFG